MTRSMVKVLSVIAALTIALVGVATKVNFTAANMPTVPAFQAADEKGVLIVSVQRDGPAARAGLRRGDIILKVNDAEVNDAQALRDALAKLKPGDEAQIRVARGDSELTFNITLGEANGRAILGVTPFQPVPPVIESIPAPPGQAPRQLPFEPGQLRKDLEEQVRRFVWQVRVTEVITDSPAAKAGLQRDDIIIAVNETRPDAQNALADVIAKFKPGDVVTLKIKRGDAKQELKVRLGEHPDKQGVAFLGIRYTPAFGVMGLLGRLPHTIPFPLPEGVPMPDIWTVATVGSIAAGSPADKAGLRQGDVILAANDKRIEAPNDLVELVQASKPGDRITLSVQRQGEDKPVEITVTLGEHPDKKGTAYLGVSLNQFIRFERILPGDAEGDAQGFEIMPGFRLPFDFNFDDLPLPFPQIPEAARREA